MFKVLPQGFTDINPFNQFCPYNVPFGKTAYKIQDSEVGMAFQGLLPEALNLICTRPGAWQPNSLGGATQAGDVFSSPPKAC